MLGNKLRTEYDSHAARTSGGAIATVTSAANTRTYATQATTSAKRR